MVDWEVVQKGNGFPHETLYRACVKGGWLYKEYRVGLCFVPDSGFNHDPPSGVGSGQVWPSMHRGVPNKQPTKEIIDAGYEEIPAQEVNGSKVITLKRRD